MKKSLRFITLLSSLLALPLFAGSITRSSTETAATETTQNQLPYEFDLEGAFVGDGDLTRGSRSIRDFTETNFLARFIFLPRTKIGYLRLGAGYELFDFDMPNFSQLPDRLQAANLIIGLDTEFSDSFLIRIEASPGIYSAGDLDTKDFNVPFILGGSYVYSSNLQFLFGVGVNFDAQYPVLPGGGVRWRMSSQWVLDAVVPKPRLEFEATKNFMIYAGAELKSGTFRVDDNFGDVNGPRRLNNAVLAYSEIRTGIGFEWKITPIIRLGVEGGYMPYRQFDYHRADIRYKEDGGAPYGNVNLHAAF